MLDEIVERINALGEKTDSEQNLKYFVTTWMLKELGYDESCFDFEHTLCRDSKNNRHADIFIQVEKGKAMFVETKKYTKTLTEEDILQLAEYISLHHEIAWGILTNGRQIFLLNNSIEMFGNDKKSIMNKVVLNIEYNPSNGQFTNGYYIKYLSKDSIYTSCVTNYFKAVAQFFAKHSISEVSEGKYKNTLWQFFDYYISQGNRYVVYGAREYAPLEDIKDKDFIEFLKNFKSTTRKATGKPPLAKCSHVCAMFDVMEKNGYISKNPMKELRKRAEVEYQKALVEDDVKSILTPKSVEIILDRLRDKPYKTVIFTLAAYYGMNRDMIAKFLATPWEMIRFEKNIFILDGKMYPMTRVLEENLREMLSDYKRRGVRKPSAIYVSKKNGVYTTVGTDSINTVFDEIKTYTEPDVNWKLFNPQNTRASAIYNMLCAGCSIEEIAYITDSPIVQLAKYLPDEIVDKKGERKWKTKGSGRERHPFRDMFE